MNLDLLDITAIIIAIVSLVLPQKYKQASVGLIIIAMCILVAEIIVEVLL